MRGAPMLTWLAPALALATAACEAPVKAPAANRTEEKVEGRFPAADRPVATIVSARWSTEDARDRLNEAETVMDKAGIKPGMTVADIGAGEGYYTIRLAARVGEEGRVLAEDIVPEVRDALAQRVARERLDNVSVRLGLPEDPRLPENSFDRILMVHMYHEIAQPYEFLWRMRPVVGRGIARRSGREDCRGGRGAAPEHSATEGPVRGVAQQRGRRPAGYRHPGGDDRCR